MSGLTGILVGGGAGLFALFLLSAIARGFIVICRPNEVVVLSGRKRTTADGSLAGYRVIIGGRAFRVPLLERADRMSLASIPIELNVTNAYSKGGIPLRVHAIANVKISSDPRVIGNAIERFLGRNPAEIARVARESLEGHLRGVLANLTPEEVNEDRLKFATELVEESSGDFTKLGLHLDTLKIQNVSDEAKYLASIGRARIAIVKRDAEMAESSAKSEAQRKEAEASRSAEVAVFQAQTAIAEKDNELRTLKANLEAEARSAEQTAQQEALRVEAEAEQKLQAVRQKLEETRLLADKVLPAQAVQQAEAFRARGEAAEIEANGRALVAALTMLSEVWAEAGPHAKDVFLIQNLEPIVRLAVDRVKAVEVAQAHLIDTGDGEALPRHVASFPAAARSVLQEMGRTTGVDILGVLSPRASGGAA